jgi:hypothetical protein
MPPAAVVLILIGFSCGIAALIKTMRSPPRALPLVLGYTGMLFIVAAGVVFYLDKQ